MMVVCHEKNLAATLSCVILTQMKFFVDEAEPPYFEKVRVTANRPDLSDVDIERNILRAWKAEWSQVPESCPYFHTEEVEFDPSLPRRRVGGWTQHMLRYQRLVFPTINIDPWFVDKWEVFERVRMGKDRRKIINMIGSKNSAKTNFFAMFCLLMVSVDPAFTKAFISGPYKSAADATIWGRVGTRFNQMKNAQPRMFSKAQEKKSDQQFIFEGSSSEAGSIELITLDKVGKLQGTKSLNPDKGWLILICDEIAEFPSKALMDALANLTGNDNFICLTGCNFKNIEGLDGDLGRPEGKEFSELDVERDHEWPSAYRSWTIRFDGHRCPNVVAKKVIYPYLLRETDRADMEAIYGLNGPKYLEQIRSFPNSSMSDYFVVTREKIRSAGGYDEFVWEDVPTTHIGFCDPGFGGDPCKIGAFKFGRGRFQDVEGQWHGINIIEPLVPIQTIQLDLTLVADEEWRQRLSALTSRDLFLKHDAVVPLEQQIAVACGEFMSQYGIERQHFGYDGSMRAAIVHEMTAILGSTIHSVDFGGKATDRTVLAGNKEAKANELYYNFVSELYFFFANVVQSGQFRGGDKIPAAIAQICRRPWFTTGAKKQIQPKHEYKLDNQGRSPDDADVVVGAFEIARRSGFMDNPRRHASTTWQNPVDFHKQLSKLPMFNLRTSRSLHDHSSH